MIYQRNCTSRCLCGAVLSFQEFFFPFSSLKSTAIPSFYDHPRSAGAAANWSAFLRWPKSPKTASQAHRGDQRGAICRVVSFCCQGKGDGGDPENVRIDFLLVAAHAGRNILQRCNISHLKTSKSASFLSDYSVFVHFRTLVVIT